jgi:hypothetical protein
MKTKLTSVAVAASCLALLCATSVTLRAATITVTSTADSGAGTLRAALASAADGDTINFAVSLPATITLSTGELVVSNSVTILGPGPGNLALDGNAASRVFHITNAVTASISSLTITNGTSVDPPYPLPVGGGIYNDHSTLTVSNCTLSGNSATYLGGGIFNFGADSGGATLTVIASSVNGNSAYGGGGIFNYGGYSGSATLTVIASTVNSNSATLDGGGIDNFGGYSGSAMLTVIASTVNSNSAPAGFGGGIFNDGVSGSATLTVSSSTLSRNLADTGGAIFNFGGYSGSAALAVSASTLSGNSAFRYGGGIFNDGESSGGATLEIVDTILNAGSPGANIENLFGSVTSDGYNLSSDAAGGDGTTGPGGLLNATGDIRNTNPLLGPLQDNGGPTFTHALLPGSPAINAGDPNFTPPPEFDQRGLGFPRVVGGRIDIGAFEVQQSGNNPPVAKCKDVTVSADSNCQATASIDDGSFDPDAGDTITLVQFPPGPYAKGVTTVTLTVTDSHGASSQCTATVTVVDDTPPTITCPENKSVPATNAKGAVVTYAAPVVSDNCSIAGVTCRPASGSLFGIGNTTVRCTVTDSAGLTAGCSFVVHVKGAAEQINDLIGLVHSYHLNGGVENALTAELQIASCALSRGNVTIACIWLKAFPTFVNVYVRIKQITAAQGAAMIAQATRIRTVLNCP